MKNKRLPCIKLSKETKIAFSGCLGGPLSIAYVICSNLKQKNNLISAIIWISAIALVCSLIFVPEELIFSPWIILFPLFFFFLTYSMLNILRKKLSSDLRIKGIIYSTLFGLTICTITFIIGIYSVPFPGYKNSIRFPNPKTVLYYNRNVKHSDAGYIAQMLHKSQFTDSPVGIDMFLKSEDSSLVLRFSIDDTIKLLNRLYVAEFKKMEYILNNQTVLNKHIIIKFTSPYLRSDYNINDTILPATGLHKDILGLISNSVNSNITILYNISVPETDLEILKETIIRLKKYFPPQYKFDVIFELKNERFNLKFFVNKINWENEDQKQRLRLVGQYLEQSGVSRPINVVMVSFDGDSVEL